MSDSWHVEKNAPQVGALMLRGFRALGSGDYKKAREFLQKASQRGVCIETWLSLVEVAECYYSGLGGSVDYVKAAQIYLRGILMSESGAFFKSNAPAEYLRLKRTMGVIAPTYEGIKIKSLADNLTGLFRDEKLTPQDFPEGMAYIQRTAKAAIADGDKTALHIKSSCLFTIGLLAYMARDRKKAAKYYRKCIKLGGNTRFEETSRENLAEITRGLYEPRVVQPSPEAFSSVVSLPEVLQVKRRVCNHCKKKDIVMKVCSGCQSVHYCNRECQKADWKSHKKQCKKKRSSPMS